MAFTAEEKVQARKFVDGIVELMEGVKSIAEVAGTHGHTLRQQIVNFVEPCRDTLETARKWFPGLIGAAGDNPDRAAELDFAKVNYEKLVGVLGKAVASPQLNSVPELSAALVHIKNAYAILSGFDWSLPYANPRNEPNPNIPFPVDLTLVGPHGDRDRTTAAMRFTVWYLTLTWREFMELYADAPIYVEESNAALKDQLNQFAHIANRVARVFSMFIGVERPEDAAAIDMDHAADSGARPRSFHVAMRQNELLFNYDLSAGKAWNGRDFEIGGVRSLEHETLERFFVPLAKANGPQWTYDMVISDVGQFGGLHASVTGKLTDFWQVYDSWAQSAFGFYHAMPVATVFIPKGSSEPGVIPVGFFDEQAAEISSQQDKLEQMDAALDGLRSGLRALEGEAL